MAEPPNPSSHVAEHSTGGEQQQQQVILDRPQPSAAVSLSTSSTVPSGTGRPTRVKRSPQRMTFDVLGGECGKRRGHKSAPAPSQQRGKTKPHSGSPQQLTAHKKKKSDGNSTQQQQQQQQVRQQHQQQVQQQQVQQQQQGQQAHSSSQAAACAPALVDSQTTHEQSFGDIAFALQLSPFSSQADPLSRAAPLQLEPACSEAAQESKHRFCPKGSISWVATFALHAQGGLLFLVDLSGLELASKHSLPLQYKFESASRILRILPLLDKEPPEGWATAPVAASNQLSAAFSSGPAVTGAAVTALLAPHQLQASSLQHSSMSEHEEHEAWALLDVVVPQGRVVARQDGAMQLEEVGSGLLLAFLHKSQPLRLELEPQMQQSTACPARALLQASAD